MRTTDEAFKTLTREMQAGGVPSTCSGQAKRLAAALGVSPERLSVDVRRTDHGMIGCEVLYNRVESLAYAEARSVTMAADAAISGAMRRAAEKNRRAA